MTGWPGPLSTDALLLGGALLVGLATILWPARADAPGASTLATPVDGPVVRRRVRRLGRRPGPDGHIVGRVRDAVRRLVGVTGSDDLEEVHLLDALAAALEAGLPTERALRLAMDSVTGAGPAPAAWSDLRRCADLGLPLAAAWTRVARRTGSPTLAAAGRSWTVATLSGAPLAAAVRSSAHAARERHRLTRAVEVATAGARATASVLGLLPVAGVGLAAVLGIGPATLYGSLPALLSAGTGLVLLATGHLIVRALVSRVVAGV